MKYIKQYFVVCAVFSLMILSGCSDQWDNRTGMTDPSVSNKTLIQLIQEDGDLSEFYKILKVTGYDQVLASTSESGSGMTVFAPTNEVLADAEISSASSVEGLKDMVRNHISLTNNISGLPGDQQRIKMANGKGVTFDSDANTVDGISLLTLNEVCKNGVLHVVEGLLTSRPSIWEFIGEQSYLQTMAVRHFMDYTLFDETSQVVGYRPNGEAIYDSLFFDLNTFIENLPVDNEDSLYVYVVMADDAFAAHHGRYARIMKQIQLDERENQVGTDSIATLQLNLDLLFRVPKVNGSFDFSLHPVMTSVQGVNVYFNSSDIIAQQTLSNGMLYVVDNCQIPLANNKVKEILIEGEDVHIKPYNDFNNNYTGDSTENKIIQIRSWASGGKKLLAQGQCYFRFRPVVYSIPYKFYWRIGRDGTDSNGGRDSLPKLQRLYISNPGAYEVTPYMNMAIPDVTTAATGRNVQFNTLDPSYPNRALSNLSTQATTNWFFSAIQDTVHYARRTLSAADTSRYGSAGQWLLARKYVKNTLPAVAAPLAGFVPFYEEYPLYTQTGTGLTPSEIARVRAGQTIYVGWLSRPNYLQEKQLFLSYSDFPYTSAGAVVSTTRVTSDLARINVNYSQQTFTFASYGMAILAVHRDYYNRTGNWGRRIYWNTSNPPALAYEDLRGVYLDYMRLVPVVDDYEGFPTLP